MDFHPDLRESGNKMLKKNALVKRGTTSGRVLVDTETYDHGFKGSPGSFIKEGFSTQVHVFLKGAGISLLLHHHGDQAIMGSGSIKMQPGLTATGKSAAKFFVASPGADVEVTVTPQITVTTEDAITGFTPEKRGCYACDEVEILK